MGFRNTDIDTPFFWTSARQPAARWHAAGEGPVQYLSTSPDASWAEFLRHQGIADPADLAGIERTMWAVELDDADPEVRPTLPADTMTGDVASYSACQAEAGDLRGGGATRINAPCAAKDPASPRGWVSDPDLRPGPPDDDRTIVLVGPRPRNVGHITAHVGRPHPSLLPFVRLL